MSYSKVKTFRPCSSSSDHSSTTTTKQTVPKSDDKPPVPIITNNPIKIGPYNRKKSDGSVSDTSTHSLVGKLTEAPGRLTPTCPGRMKAPPVCKDRGLKRVASTVSFIDEAF
jgi:hypothetical protein